MQKLPQKVVQNAMMEFAVKVVPNGGTDRAQELTLTTFQFWQSIPTFIGTATNVSHSHQLKIPECFSTSWKK